MIALAGHNIIHDSWLSHLIGKGAYHLHPTHDPESISNLEEKNIFVDIKVPILGFEIMKTISKQGFSLIDTNISFSKSTEHKIHTSKHSRFARDDDAKKICAIAYGSFTKSRFHLDPQIDNSIANTIKREWANNYFNGTRGKWMIVSEYKNQLAGFLTILINHNNELVIDLIAVAPDFRGKGLGKDMIQYACENCHCINKTITVGTQLCNTESIQFYESMGFKYLESKHIFHYHG